MFYVVFSDKQRLMMETPGDRLKEAIRKRGFETVAAFADRHHLNKMTVRAHANGQNGLSAKKAEAYADALGVSPEWLLYGKSEPLELPENDKDAALFMVEHAQLTRERPLTPSEKLAVVQEMEAVIAKARGRKAPQD